MLLDTLAEPIDRRRGTRLLLLAIIVLSLPCYCLGFVLLAYAPASSDNDVTPRSTIPTLGGITSTPFTTPTPTRFGPSATPTQFGNPLLPTPGQIFLRTNTPFVWPTPIPTWTFMPLPTTAPSLTSPPLPTIAPSATLQPTNVPPPTVVPPTDAPPPTDEPPPPPTSRRSSRKLRRLRNSSLNPLQGDLVKINEKKIEPQRRREHREKQGESEVSRAGL